MFCEGCIQMLLYLNFSIKKILIDANSYQKFLHFFFLINLNNLLNYHHLYCFSFASLNSYYQKILIDWKNLNFLPEILNFFLLIILNNLPELPRSQWFQRERKCPMCRAEIADDPKWKDGSTSPVPQLIWASTLPLNSSKDFK